MNKNMDIENIFDEDLELAIIIRRSYKSEGIEFFTPNSYSQQMGYMNRPAGYEIKPHIHNLVPREVEYTNEVLFIRTGRLRVDFYRENQSFLMSRELEQGDIILLIRGGHGFKMLEPTEIIEIKQGPYTGQMDKIHFDPTKENFFSND